MPQKTKPPKKKTPVVKQAWWVPWQKELAKLGIDGTHIRV